VGVKRLGVLGGTFDPVHYGHLVAAQEVGWSLRLDRVLFVPAARSPHKLTAEVSPVQHRVAMIEIAIADNPLFALSTVDVDRPGPSYTVDTLAILKQAYGEDVELFFIVGMDALAELPSWREPERVLSLARLVGVTRPPFPTVDLGSLAARLPGSEGRIDLVAMPGLDISASDLRLRVAQGRPIRYLLPPGVEAYIARHGLYRSSASASTISPTATR